MKTMILNMFLLFLALTEGYEDFHLSSSNVLTYNGGYVCGDNFYEDEARAVCRFMGMTYSSYTKNYYTGISAHYTIDNLNCPSSASTLSDCSYTSHDDCGAWDGVKLYCIATTTAEPVVSSCGSETWHGFDIDHAYDIGSVIYASYHECFDRCETHPDCLAFSFPLESGGIHADQCVLKSYWPSWNSLNDEGVETSWMLMVIGLTCKIDQSSISSSTSSTSTSSPASCVDTNGGFSDSHGDPCSLYNSGNAMHWCGNYDTSVFFSNEMCCACGGGSSRTTTPAPVVDVCCDIMMINGLPEIHESRNALFTKTSITHDGYPVYENESGDYLYYWLSSADWHIGSDYTTDWSWVASVENKDGCPESFSTWVHSSQGGFVDSEHTTATCYSPMDHVQIGSDYQICDPDESSVLAGCNGAQYGGPECTLDYCSTMCDLDATCNFFYHVEINSGLNSGRCKKLSACPSMEDFEPSLGNYRTYTHNTYYMAAHCYRDGDFITDKDKCELAHNELGLDDPNGVASESDNPNTPFGCYYRGISSDKKLWFNTNEDANKENDATERMNLCMISNRDSVPPTYFPTHSPTINPTQFPTTSKPTHFPSAMPSNAPTKPVPTAAPVTSAPTVNPTGAPSGSPSFSPVTGAPSHGPSDFPSVNPTSMPSQSPSVQPTAFASQNPTTTPSNLPTVHPTAMPSNSPTVHPTTMPSNSPTANPTSSPSVAPSFRPTSNPTHQPTNNPTNQPTSNPSSQPTVDPTNAPSVVPTSTPTYVPTFNPTVLFTGENEFTVQYSATFVGVENCEMFITGLRKSTAHAFAISTSQVKVESTDCSSSVRRRLAIDSSSFPVSFTVVITSYGSETDAAELNELVSSSELQSRVDENLRNHGFDVTRTQTTEPEFAFTHSTAEDGSITMIIIACCGVVLGLCGLVVLKKRCGRAENQDRNSDTKRMPPFEDKQIQINFSTTKRSFGEPNHLKITE